MCTVSFYKNEYQTIITSNRDEHFSRAQALQPQIYRTGQFDLTYCKDPKANGTWMALRNDGTAIVLLNGAFEKHALQLPYKRSRGLVLLDIIMDKNCLQKFENYDLVHIEPFTIILYHHPYLYECIWNSTEKFIVEKPAAEKYIWSSVTLYDEEFRKMKQKLYQQLLNTKEELHAEDILKFHHSEQDLENGFIINRDNQLKTFSVTQIVLNGVQNTFYHHDIIDDQIFRLTQDESI